MKLILLFISTVLINNFVLSRFLGICPFLGVSKKVEVAFSMGLAATFVMTLSAIATWLVQHYILMPFGLERFLQNVAFILIIASLVQFVEMFLKKSSPGLYQSLGIFLPLITTNCAILGLALIAANNNYNLIESTVFGFAAGAGFTLAITAMAGLREQFEFGDVPEPFKGVPITLITAAIMSMAFLGFSGLIAM